jgi:hypothetical protein
MSLAMSLAERPALSAAKSEKSVHRALSNAPNAFDNDPTACFEDLLDLSSEELFDFELERLMSSRGSEEEFLR